MLLQPGNGRQPSEQLSRPPRDEVAAIRARAVPLGVLFF